MSHSFTLVVSISSICFEGAIGNLMSSLLSVPSVFFISYILMIILINSILIFVGTYVSQRLVVE